MASHTTSLITLSVFGVFVMQGSQEPHLVKLFLRESCSCPATSTCYHVTAYKLILCGWSWSGLDLLTLTKGWVDLGGCLAVTCLAGNVLI